MDGTTLHGTAERCAESLPGTTLYPFAPGWEAARVHGKWFMLMTEVPRHSRVRDARVLAGRPVVIVKSTPSEAVALREEYAHITAGYHMNKRHWITLAPGDSIDADLVEELVSDSYRLVVAALPESRRPAGPAGPGGPGSPGSPETFGG